MSQLNREELETEIAANITMNGTGAISGPILGGILDDIVDSAVIYGDPTVASVNGQTGVIVGLATLDSPVFTGAPQAPTPAPGDDSAALATTAFIAAYGASPRAAPPQGRLTLTSGTPVLVASVLSSPTVLYTPFLGSFVPLWNGTNYVLTAFGELTNVLANSAAGKAGPGTGATNSIYDLFVWSDAGTIRLTRGTPWSSATARSAGTAIQRQGGLWVNSSAIVNGPAAGFGTYVGTIATDAAAVTVTFNRGGTAAGGGLAWLGLWNCYNRIQTGVSVNDSNASWTYATAAFRAADGSNANRATFVRGLDEDTVEFAYSNLVSVGASGAPVIGIDLDGTGGVAPLSVIGAIAPNTTAVAVAEYCNLPGQGQHFLQAVEQVLGAVTGTFNVAFPTNSGLIGSLWF